MTDTTLDAVAELVTLREENERLRTALSRYADRDNWIGYTQFRVEKLWGASHPHKIAEAALNHDVLVATEAADEGAAGSADG